MNAYVLALTLLSAAGTYTVWAGQPEEASYRDHLAFAGVQVSGGFTLSRVAMETLPFTGASLLEERSKSGARASGNSTRENLLQLRKDIASVMAKLGNPPAEYSDAYEQLRGMYDLYKKLSDSLLDTPMPQQLPEVEILLLTQRFDHLRQTLKVLIPVADSH
jgi:hypothetical protein